MSNNTKHSKILWLDTETTGLDPRKNDIVELAWIAEIDGEIRSQDTLRFAPVGKIDSKALEINGLTAAILQSYPPASDSFSIFRKQLERFVDRYDKADKFIVAGYFVQFDIDFLRELFLKQGDKYYGSYFFAPSIDVKTYVAEMIARYNLRLPDYKLSTVCGAFRISIDAHHAMSDIVATRELHRMIREVR